MKQPIEKRSGKKKLKKRRWIPYHDAKRCTYCKEWYQLSMKNLRYIHNKEIKKRLKHLFETLWVNNCGDFDIIYYEFAEDLSRIQKLRHSV